MTASTNNGKPWLTLMAEPPGVWGWELPPMSEEEVSVPRRGPGEMSGLAGDAEYTAEIGISPELMSEIEAWQAWGEEWWDEDKTFDSEAFDKKGRELALRLKAEIGDRYNIRLFLDKEGKFVVV